MSWGISKKKIVGGMKALVSQIVLGKTLRDYDNPLRGLTVDKAIRLMESYNTGDFADLMWTFAAPFLGIENSDPDYLSIVERRVGALKEMNYKISMWKPGRDEKPDPAKADLAQRSFDALNGEYERYENVKEAIAHLALAKFRGFSILEPNLAEGEFIPVDHWNVRRDGGRGDWYWNESGQSGTAIEDCDPFNRDRIILLESPRPIGRIALLKYIRANLSEQDWDYFIEIYGIPSGVVIAPSEVNTPEKLAVFRAAAAAASKGSDAAFPAGTTYTANDSPRGMQPFQPRLEWLSQKLVQAGTGGFLTMLSMSGSGTLAGSAHMEAFRILARADAADISEAMQKQFDQPVLRAKGLLQPGQRPLAWFEISSREEQSTQEAADQVVAMSQHFDLDPMQVEERTGWKVTAKPPQAATPAAGLFRSAGRPPVAYREDEAAEADLSAAIAQDLAPVAERLDEMLEQEGGDLQAAAKRLLEELPDLARQIAIDPAAAALIEKAMRQAAGLEEAEVPAGGEPHSQKFITLKGGRVVPIGEDGEPNYDALGKGKEPETKKSSDRYGVAVGERLAKDAQLNLDRGRKVLDEVLEKHGAVDDGMFREETGWIRFHWGDPGNPNPDAEGNTYVGGHGISHIAAKHPKDLKYLPEVLARGDVYHHEEDGKQYVLHGNRFAVLASIGKGNKKTITEFEPNSPSKIESIKKRPPAHKPGEN